VTISRVQVEFIVNFRVLPNSRNGVYAHTNRLKSRNESVNSASHIHSNCLLNFHISPFTYEIDTISYQYDTESYQHYISNDTSKSVRKKVWMCFHIFCVFMVYSKDVFIPITRRVKGYTRFVGMYVAGKRNRFRPHKVYLFLIRITSRVDLAMSVCLSVCPDERWHLGNYKS